MLRRPKMWFKVSLATILICLLVIVTLRPQWGIDFVGGSLMEIDSQASLDDVRGQVAQVVDGDVSAQRTQEGSIILRTPPLTEEEHQIVLSALREGDLLDEELRFESIGPTIGRELQRKVEYDRGDDRKE
jgi:preprotein translocase subunit SecF